MSRSHHGPASERLAQDDIASGDLLAVSHLHRYELVRELARDARVVDLCCGVGYCAPILGEVARSIVGVDISADAIDEARERHGDAATFVVSDAREFVDRLDPGDVEIVVCFEGVEHVPDATGLADALARLVRHGVKLVVSLPNSAGFEEENDFHTVDFGYEEAKELLGRIGEHEVLTQRLGEGSIITAAGPSSSAQEGRVVVRPHDTSAAWAGHWLGVFNVDGDTLRRANVRLMAAAVPNQHRYMRALERSNEELYRTNLRLSREHLGRHDSGAGVTVGRLERAANADLEEAARLQLEVERLEARLAMEVQVAFENDANFQSARRQLARPHHRAADKAALVVAEIPFSRRAVRWVMARRDRRRRPGS